MRKQTEFKFRVYPVGNTEGHYNQETLSAEIKAQYLDNGWEVLSTEIAQVAGNEIRLAVTLVKYEEDWAQVTKAPDVIGDGTVIDVTKRGPGRPKKEEVVPA